MSDDNELNDGNVELHSLLSPTINDWSFVYRYVRSHPQKSRERYYRNESPLQLALKASERKRRGRRRRGQRSTTENGEHNIGRVDVLKALIDADPSSIHSRDSEGKWRFIH